MQKTMRRAPRSGMATVDEGWVELVATVNHKGLGGGWRAVFALLAVAVLLAADLPVGDAAQGRRDRDRRGDRSGTAPSIVVLPDGSDPVAAAAALGVVPRHVYREVFTGFAADLPPAAVTTAQGSRGVRRIEPDGKARIQAEPAAARDRDRDRKRDRKRDRRARNELRDPVTPQVVPTGVARIRAVVAEEPTVSVPVDAGIAVLDTGVAKVPDLNVAGGKACVGDRPFRDDNGHGTHVAGTAAAIDNDKDAVGVAPGARILSVKVLGADGSGRWSDVICGLEWVIRNQTAEGIDVVNLSLGGPGSDGGSCAASALHQAVCNVVDAGIPVVVAAGNQGRDAATRKPAAYDEAITVAALADSDGNPGGLGPRCSNSGDDHAWVYSNFGDDVDISAPGSCIRSLRAGGGLTTYSGTSMATPHVAGALARFLSENPIADPGDRVEAARAWLAEDASAADGEDGGCLIVGVESMCPKWTAPTLWLPTP
jgi:subtilisin